MKITYIKTGKRMKDNKVKDVYNDFKIKNREEIQKNNIITNLRNARKNTKFKGREAMQTILKKNQLVIISLALMLITAGYMNYTNNANELNISLAELGDAKLVGTNVYYETPNLTENIANDEANKEASNVANEVKNEVFSPIESKNENILSNNGVEENVIDSNAQVSNQNEDSKDYFVKTRLERDTMYSQMLETYQKILENEKIPADQKGIASNEIKNINDRKSAIAIVENIIKTKNFEDVAILINDNSINVVVKQKENLTEEQVAQIANVVSRELKAEIGDIHITVHK